MLSDENNRLKSAGLVWEVVPGDYQGKRDYDYMRRTKLKLNIHGQGSNPTGLNILPSNFGNPLMPQKF